MDFASAIVLFVILFLLFSLCGFCCRSKRRGTVFSTCSIIAGKKSAQEVKKYAIDSLKSIVVVSICIIIFILLSIRRRRLNRRMRNAVTFSSIPFGLIFFIIILCISVFKCCNKGDRRTIYPTPVVVTSATHTAPGVYPTGVQTVSVYPTAATNYQQGVYPQQAPYPVNGGMPMPMPMPMQSQMNPPPAGMAEHTMPPYPTTGPGMNPPSYDTAVGTGANANSSNPAYEKQMPYNPSYATGYQ